MKLFARCAENSLKVRHAGQHAMQGMKLTDHHANERNEKIIQSTLSFERVRSPSFKEELLHRLLE